MGAGVTLFAARHELLAAARGQAKEPGMRSAWAPR